MRHATRLALAQVCRPGKVSGRRHWRQRPGPGEPGLRAGGRLATAGKRGGVVPYVLKIHDCWTPLGLLVQDGSIWQCGKCKQYWRRERALGRGWSRTSERWAKLVTER